MNASPTPTGTALLPREAQSPKPAPPELPEDSNSQALSEALGSSFVIVKFVMAILVIVFLGSGVQIVGPQEKAIVLRFGKPVGEGEHALLGPGLHWAFPRPIDEVVKIPVGQAQSVVSTIGWYQTTAAMEAAKNEPPPSNSLNPLTEGYVLTADGNIIHVRGTLRYRISEPGLRYMFDFSQTSNLVQNAFNNALVYVAAHYQVDEVLTRDYAGFKDSVRARLEQSVERQGLGITVDQIDLQPIAPRWLKSQFDAVLESGVRREKVLNEARSYASQTTNQAKAQASTLITVGETDRKRLVELVAAEAKRFTDLLPGYRKDPQLFVRMHQMKTLQQVLTNAQERWVLPRRADGSSAQLRLLLSREPEKIGTVARPVEEGH